MYLRIIVLNKKRSMEKLSEGESLFVAFVSIINSVSDGHYYA